MKTLFLPEWHPQSGVMLTWPHEGTDWAPMLDAIEAVFIDLARLICAREKLLICVPDEAKRQQVYAALQAAKVPMRQVQLHIVPSDDTWARDHGPIAVQQNDELQLLDFIFNGWGNKFDAEQDNRINRTLAQQNAFGHIELRSINLVLEGGSLETDGHGTLLTTRRCLLSPQRNPQLNEQQVEQELARLLGVNRVLWLSNGYLAGDDTDSHIDTLVRFCDPHTLCYVSCDDPSDEHHAELQAMAQELAAFRDYQGNPYHLVPLPMPAPIYDAEGARMPATYANFLIINGAVLVPTYDDPMDALALERLTRCFPEREVIGVPSRAIVMQHGSLHCLTMQLPEGVL